METNNENNVNKELIDHIPSEAESVSFRDNDDEVSNEATTDEAPTDEVSQGTAGDEEENFPDLATIDLCSCRFAFSIDSIEWDTCDIEQLIKSKGQFVAARFNLITTNDIEKRAEIADAILKDVSEIEANLGLSVDYYNIREDITKIESALLAICDAITIYDWHINQLRALEYQKTIEEFLENTNVEFVSDAEADMEAEQVEREVVNVSPEVANALTQSFIDDHNESGLLDE